MGSERQIFDIDNTIDKALDDMLGDHENEGERNETTSVDRWDGELGGQERDNPQEYSEESQGKKQKKKKKKKKSSKLLIASVIVVLILVIVLGGVIGAGLTVVHTKLDMVSQVQVNREALGIDARVAKELKNYRNIALLGIDARDMTDDSETRSDAMIIASVDKATNDVRLVSLYRDTYVSLGDNYGLDKMTHAYFYGGATQTLQTINRNLDLNCEEVVVVNWKSVADTVDALGGLDIEIQESEINEMNKYIKDTQKNIGGSKKKIKKAGMQTLNGIQAVTYARIRKDSIEGDHRRNERMKIVLSAAFDKAKTLSLSRLNQIANEILPGIKTNMSTNQMMEVLLELNTYQITESKNWPYDMTDWTHNNIWYGPPVTLKRNVVKLHEEFFKQKDYEPTDTVNSISDSISSVTGFW
ncbi:MAG: LCP family protein [Firmicutes bacterium]|nr:LCP family protein [Bacillota bacterium]